MLNPSPAYQTANAKLAKKLVWLIEVAGYHYGFSNQSLGTFTPPVAPTGTWLGPVTVPGTAMPWNASDPFHGYYLVNPGTPGVLIPCSPGSAVILEYVSGLVYTPSNGYSTDAIGGPTLTTGGIHPWPSDRYAIPSNAGELAGAFIDASGAVLAVFRVGDSLTTPVAPAGTANLSLGVNSYESWNANTGSWSINYQYATSITATAEPWLVSIDDLKLTVSDLDGGSDLSDLVFNLQDHAQLITADLPSFVFEGKECRLYEGFDGMAVSDFLLRYRGVINTVDSDSSNTEYKFTVSSFNLKKLTGTIYATGDDGFATDSKHPKTLNGHPLDILVSALTQAGVSSSDIDTLKIHYYRDTIFNGLSFVFTLTKAPVAKDFLENEIMKPLGMYLWENSSGLVSVNSFYPAISAYEGYTPPTPPVMTLTIDTTMEVPLAAEADLVNQVVMRFDDDGTGSSKFLAENIATYTVAINKYGLTDAHIIESQGMRSGFQGYLWSAVVSRLIFLRYGKKNLFFDPLPAFWTASVLEPGDIIAVTEPFVPDRTAGSLGITGKTFEVLDRNWKFMNAVVELKLLALDISAFKQYLIAPNGEADYTAAGSTDQGKYMFLCGTSGTYSNGAPGNTLG